MEKIYHDEEMRIKELLMGKSVEKVGSDELVLNDGVKLRIEPNEGCGGCSSGWYDITELNGCENIITNVVLQCDDLNDYESFSYKIFVFAKDKQIKLLQVNGSDGNGYYGTGYSIIVKGVEGCTK